MLNDDENKPYEGLMNDMLDLLGMVDREVNHVLTDFQVGQLVRKRVHAMKIDNEKFSNALAEEIKRGKGCRICFYTGFQMGFTGWGSMLDPTRSCGYCDGTAEGSD